MRVTSTLARPIRSWISIGLVYSVAMLLAAGSLTSCGGATSGPDGGPHTVEMTAVDYAFQAPDTIPAGWITFLMTNKGQESHHFHLDRLPEGRTFAEWRKAFHEPRKNGDLINGDSIKAHWGFPANLEKHGGMGLVAPSRTGEATHRVPPGHYLMICVIDDSSGRIHASHDMVDGLVAVESSAERSPPTPDATVRSVGQKLRTDNRLTAGTQTVGFRVEEVPERWRKGTDGYYSVWLARFGETTSTSVATEWNYDNPAPYQGLGGFEYLPPTETAYITADITPGRYAWIWFYEGMDLLGEDSPLVETFTVD